METLPTVQKPRLRDLLASETERQRRSYRRVTLLTVLVALLGAAWLAFSAFNVIKFERRGAEAQAKVTELEQKSAGLLETIKDQESDLQTKTTSIADRQRVLDDLEKKIKLGQWPEALRVISDSNKQFKREVNTELPGFISSDRYEGPDRTAISIQVIPAQPKRGDGPLPNNLFTYVLDGKNYFQPPPDNRISFSLDRSIGTTRTLVLLLDFRNGEPRNYTVKATASAGRVRSKSFSVPALSQSGAKQITLVFVVK